MIPAKLKAILDQNGYVTVQQFADAIGLRYQATLRQINCGAIPATDVSDPKSKRSSWRLFEGDLLDYFASRRNKPAPSPEKREPEIDWVARTRMRHDSNGNYIGPELN